MGTDGSRDSLPCFGIVFVYSGIGHFHRGRMRSTCFFTGDCMWRHSWAGTGLLYLVDTEGLVFSDVGVLVL